jgi:rubredoxin
MINHQRSIVANVHPNTGNQQTTATESTSTRRCPMANWKCANCGYELEAEAPPETCPSCKQKCEFMDNTCYTPDCQYEGKDPRIK